MPKLVTKRYNPQKREELTEEFKEEKLRNSIKMAALQAGREEESVFSIVEEVAEYVMEHLGEREEVDSQEIRELVLEYLKENYPDIYQSWVEYDRTVKGREE
jgi:transcriptional regulator NrdR family protein